MRYLICMLMVVGMANVAQAGNARNVNFLIFKKSQPSFEYDPIMFGDFNTFIKDMHGARLVLLSRSAQSVDGDVINLQQDLLKEVKGGEFNDAGVDCQLNFKAEHDVSNVEYQLDGRCQLSGNFHGKFISINTRIPKTVLPDTAKGTDVWIEVYEDKRSGIAFYANVSLN